MCRRRFTSPLLMLALLGGLLLAELHVEARVGAQTPVSITVQTDGTAVPLDSRLLGTNVPAWLAPERLSDPTFRARTIASGVGMLRLPGGSWSNDYDWLACETGTGIDATAVCQWPWAARPSDFVDLLQATGLPGMLTINFNGTSHEAAALVAFMNGSVSNERVIGVDVRGRDWGTVADWARLRRDNGHSAPADIRYWEIGNEIFGGKPGSGTDCVPWGWENVWTCDGTEYVNGLGTGAARREGYLEFRDAMRAVDPTILVGAVGVPLQTEYNNWGSEVIAAAGGVMDFYIIHQYAFFEPPGDNGVILAQPEAIWPFIVRDAHNAFDVHANGRNIPIAVTEYNLFSVQEIDNDQVMTRAVNALFLADSIGQMARLGIPIANQWNLSNGQAENGTDYGLLDSESFSRYPQYYVFPLWARFGSEMLPVTNGADAATTLAVYAGRIDADTYSLLAINKTGSPLLADIRLAGSGPMLSSTVDRLQATSLDAQTVTFNGKTSPADDLSDAPPALLPNPANPLRHTFAPYSVTLLRMNVDTTVTPAPEPSTPRLYLPLVTEKATPQTGAQVAESDEEMETSRPFPLLGIVGVTAVTVITSGLGLFILQRYRRGGG